MNGQTYDEWLKEGCERAEEIIDNVDDKESIYLQQNNE